MPIIVETSNYEEYEEEVARAAHLSFFLLCLCVTMRLTGEVFRTILLLPSLVNSENLSSMGSWSSSNIDPRAASVIGGMVSDWIMVEASAWRDTVDSLLPEGIHMRRRLERCV